MMRGGVSLGAVILSVLSISATRCSDNFSTEKPDCKGRVVTIPAGGELGCDVNPPQQLNAAGVSYRWCMRHGGDFGPPRPRKNQAVVGLCRDIDY